MNRLFSCTQYRSHAIDVHINAILFTLPNNGKFLSLVENDNVRAPGYCDSNMGNTATRHVKFGMVRNCAYVLGKFATLQSIYIKSNLYS
jgi:hypothetical protein